MRQRSSLVLLIAAITLSALVPAAGAATNPKEQHCVLQITGKNPVTGEYLTAPLVCDVGAGSRILARITIAAVHYTGANFTGGSLSIVGDTCSGGWLNMPNGWQNVITSTSSACGVAHYDDWYLVGALELTFNPGGNLGSLDNRTNSASYN
jgi:hypothetical protein